MSEERNEGVVRMDAYMWTSVGKIFAANARVEAMKAANDARKDQGRAQAYGEEMFFGQAAVIFSEAESLAKCI
jgi:hypothetical protein